jgi:serine/threonine-protein kinase
MATSPRAELGASEPFGRYRLLHKIAAGGMGEIFLARLEGEGGFEKLLTIKRLLPELVASPEFVTMFLNEARLAAQLSHSNICDIYELGQVDDRYFIAMPYLQGVPMSRVATNRVGDSELDHVRLVVGLGEQACEGLAHAHELTDPQGRPYDLVHRDVSPSNLFATFDGVLKLLDFGIAKARGVPSLTSKGSIRGKFAYMSPEQIRGDEVDRRSDLFSLGVVLFEALARRRMFERPSEFLIAKAILEEEYPLVHVASPAVPEPLSWVIARALRRRPEERFASAREMGAALRESIEAVGGPLAPAAIGERLRARFASDLADQRGVVDRATEQAAALDRATESVAAPVPVAAGGGTAPTRSLRGSGPMPTYPAPAPPVEPADSLRGRRGLLALIGAAGLIGAALIAWGALRSRPAPAVAAADAGAASTAAAVTDAGRPPPPDADSPPAPDAAPPPIDAAPRPAPRDPPAPVRHAPKPPGFYTIDSDPYATIYVDGQKLGVTPIIKRPLAAGKHTVKAVLDDGRSKSFPIRIRSKRETRKKLRW